MPLEQWASDLRKRAHKLAGAPVSRRSSQRPAACAPRGTAAQNSKLPVLLRTVARQSSSLLSLADTNCRLAASGTAREGEGRRGTGRDGKGRRGTARDAEGRRGKARDGEADTAAVSSRALGLLNFPLHSEDRSERNCRPIRHRLAQARSALDIIETHPGAIMLEASAKERRQLVRYMDAHGHRTVVVVVAAAARCGHSTLTAKAAQPVDSQRSFRKE